MVLFHWEHQWEGDSLLSRWEIKWVVESFLASILRIDKHIDWSLGIDLRRLGVSVEDWEVVGEGLGCFVWVVGWVL
jgi:hypothetical protein